MNPLRSGAKTKNTIGRGPCKLQLHARELRILPDLPEAIALNLSLARRTNPAARCAGVSLNTSKLSEEGAHSMLARRSAELGLPCADPLRGGSAFNDLVNACLSV